MKNDRVSMNKANCMKEPDSSDKEFREIPRRVCGVFEGLLVVQLFHSLSKKIPGVPHSIFSFLQGEREAAGGMEKRESAREGGREGVEWGGVG